MCCFQARGHDLHNSISKTSMISAQFILNNESQCQSFLATTLMMFIVLSTHSLLRAIGCSAPSHYSHFTDRRAGAEVVFRGPWEVELDPEPSFSGAGLRDAPSPLS